MYFRAILVWYMENYKPTKLPNPNPSTFAIQKQLPGEEKKIAFVADLSTTKLSMTLFSLFITPFSLFVRPWVARDSIDYHHSTP